jgi:hypothetical protein
MSSAATCAANLRGHSMLAPTPAARAADTAAAKEETALAVRAAAPSKTVVRKPAATAATPKDASTNPCQKLTTNCQPCLSADANECYNIAYNLNPNYFASTGKSGDSRGSLPCIFVSAGLVGISGCGINAASGEKDGSAGAPGTGEAAETKAAPRPPAAATQATLSIRQR